MLEITLKDGKVIQVPIEKKKETVSKSLKEVMREQIIKKKKN